MFFCDTEICSFCNGTLSVHLVVTVRKNIGALFAIHALGYTTSLLIFRILRVNAEYRRIRQV